MSLWERQEVQKVPRRLKTQALHFLCTMNFSFSIELPERSFPHLVRLQEATLPSQIYFDTLGVSLQLCNTPRLPPLA